jgi:hypothetical protein
MEPSSRPVLLHRRFMVDIVEQVDLLLIIIPQLL